MIDWHFGMPMPESTHWLRLIAKHSPHYSCMASRVLYQHHSLIDWFTLNLAIASFSFAWCLSVTECTMLDDLKSNHVSPSLIWSQLMTSNWSTSAWASPISAAETAAATASGDCSGSSSETSGAAIGTADLCWAKAVTWKSKWLVSRKPTSKQTARILQIIISYQFFGDTHWHNWMTANNKHNKDQCLTSCTNSLETHVQIDKPRRSKEGMGCCLSTSKRALTFRLPGHDSPFLHT